MTDRQAFEAMAEKWPELLHGFSMEIRCETGRPEEFVAQNIHGNRELTSDDYQFLAGKLGYVIQPFPVYRDGEFFAWSFATSLSPSLDDYAENENQYSTMLQAMQAGFHRVVELATKENPNG